MNWLAGRCSARRRPTAAHFQHYEKLHLAREFCERMGNPDAGKLYLDLAERMPAGWRPAFFGMFRRRPDSPLRVCGYLSIGGLENDTAERVLS